MASSLIATYVSGGLAASKPAAPVIAAGTIALYFATDTGKLFAYAAGTWHQLN